MSGVLLDTNVISELASAGSAPPVVAFLAARDDLWLSTLVLHELEFGLLLRPDGSRRDSLRNALSEFVQRYEDRILPVGRRAAAWSARFRAEARQRGRPLDLGDALIAGTAKAHDLALATRNVADFGGFDFVVTNPWNFRSPDAE